LHAWSGPIAAHRHARENVVRILLAQEMAMTSRPGPGSPTNVWSPAHIRVQDRASRSLDGSLHEALAELAYTEYVQHRLLEINILVLVRSSLRSRDRARLVAG